MTRAVWSVADCIVSPLGFTSEENYANLRRGVSGVRLMNNTSFSEDALVVSAMEDTYALDELTRFESLCMRAIQGALKQVSLPRSRTLFILSTTKGNIDLLDTDQKDHPRIHLHTTARYLSTAVGFDNALVVSNACISGVLALQVAKRFIEAGRYDHAIVAGADVLSHFVISGFQSLQALSSEPCKPFDTNRSGINLGEAAAVMVLSAKPEELEVKPSIRLLGSGLTNDANHISGPSRTGEELALAIHKALITSLLVPHDIDFISAHGTATRYNDEMEAKAFSHAGMEAVPVNSLKGYYGHTLGAAGILETIVSIQSLLHDELLPTKGFDTLGVSKEINICHQLQSKPLRTILKTASGFGGCNAALVVQKENKSNT